MKNENNGIKSLLKQLLTDEEYKTLERAIEYHESQGDD